MAMSNEDLKKHFCVLKIEDDIVSVSLKDVNVAFRKLALILHPDKAGSESTSAFQELLDSFDKVLNHFKAKDVRGNESSFENDEDERFFKDNFHKFNFPFANKGSFTVTIEDFLADTWQECMTKYLGDPKVVINAWGTECDRIWKVQHGKENKIEITVHIYNKPKNKKCSKLMLQGSIQSLICSYVFEELPKIYKMVCDNKPKPLEDKIKSKKKTYGKPIVKCDQCKFKSSMVQMKMHIQNADKPRRASKRLSVFTPVAKPFKRSKFDKGINSEGIFDDSILLTSVNMSSFVENSLEENIPEAVKTEAEEQATNHVEMTGLFFCDLCDFDSESDDELKEHKNGGLHMTESHATHNCKECNFSFKDEALLKDHMIFIRKVKLKNYLKQVLEILMILI